MHNKEEKIEDDKERLLRGFLERLSESVFLRSTNSVTDEVEHLNPKILDMEAIIEISGQWDREELKEILLSLLSPNTKEE